MEFTNVIDSDATTVDIKNVLGHGLSDAIAILGSELTTLDRTVTASAPMLQTITRLGAGLNAFNANVAPIAAVSRNRYLPNVPEEQLSPAMPEQTLIPAASQSDHYNGSNSAARLDRATARPSKKYSRPEGILPPPHQVLQREPVIMPHEGPTSTQPIAPQPPVSPIAAPTSPAVESTSSDSTSDETPSGNPTSVIALSIAPGTPEVVHSHRPEVSAMSSPKAPSMTPTDGSAVTPDIRMRRIVIGAMAPNDSLQTPTDTPATQEADRYDTVGTQTLPGTTMTPRPAAVPTAQPEGAPSASAAAEPSPAESGSRQGMIILDGAQLGRWVMDHLERHASRPGGMTTGFDPRMNAAYPGAPTGT